MWRSIGCIVLIVLIGGCTVASTPTGPSSTVAPSSVAATPTPATEPSFAIPVVPAIDPAFTPVVPDGTRGAFALGFRGPLSGTEVSGDATCLWNWTTGEPVADGIGAEGIALLGEEVSIFANPDGLTIHRRSAGAERARYEPASHIRQWQVGDLTVVAFDDLEVVATAEPETEPGFSAFYAPLGGRTDTAHLRGVLAWRCEVPVAPPPSPYAPPSPACPAPSVAPDKPTVEVSLASGPTVTALAGSYDLLTCSTAESGDAVGEPDEPLVAKPGAQPLATVSGGWRLLRWTGSYRPPGSEERTSWAPVDLPSRPRTVELPAPASPGDWVVDLDLVMTTDDGRAVGTFGFSFLLRVAS